MKLLTNGIDHTVTSDKCKPRKQYTLKISERKTNPKESCQRKIKNNDDNNNNRSLKIEHPNILQSNMD